MKLLSVVAVFAALMALIVGAAGSASAQANSFRGPASAQAHSNQATTVAPAVAISAINTVKVTDALLRSQPNIFSTKLDVAQRGQGIDLYCWVHPGGDYIWFWAHPWGSRYTGYMRADLISWATYPSPYQC
jgi:hypothetical protein